jgi:hypothetical protein
VHADGAVGDPAPGAGVVPGAVVPQLEELTLDPTAERTVPVTGLVLQPSAAVAVVAAPDMASSPVVMASAETVAATFVL